ncbi:LysM peptidoglycan-binding domain-containing protein [Bacillus sp. V5-8f]|uniref:LysM peptidoglycan-binding domain-containing protein n=1 Tax=Bacillus sp. V5-8f TaxID=2053044 RepID=UPI000C77EADB|nr:LysM peptidoglycan-binding domain-containing protein [Bacillus sp. V5-8f]PLT35608.1 hypothetical protein CUU64_03110 [Bacillus sp. V5-8f]
MNTKKWLIGITTSAVILWGGSVTSAHEKTYTVKSGDTLWKIATGNSVSVENIKKWNGLKSNQIVTGQKLSMLAPHTHEISYIVKQGNTLPTIAKNYNLLIADIKLKNNLTSDTIRPGQKLLLPNQKGTYSSHTVIKGDTLFKISRDYNVPLQNLKLFNNLNTDAVNIGQVLKLTAPVNAVAANSEIYIQDGVFPLAKGTYKPYSDTWGDSRAFGGTRTHEGTDILAAKGTPLYSPTDGIIERYGWNELGGWRITIKTKEGYLLYFAHLSKYASGLGLGVSVKKGQLIGQVGDSGYGPQGTTGKFVSHLHFGVYNPQWRAVNGYKNLRHWELNE